MCVCVCVYVCMHMRMYVYTQTEGHALGKRGRCACVVFIRSPLLYTRSLLLGGRGRWGCLYTSIYYFILGLFILGLFYFILGLFYLAEEEDGVVVVKRQHAAHQRIQDDTHTPNVHLIQVGLVAQKLVNF